jgi:hypothetical protein
MQSHLTSRDQYVFVFVWHDFWVLTAKWSSGLLAPFFYYICTKQQGQHFWQKLGGSFLLEFWQEELLNFFHIFQICF